MIDHTNTYPDLVNVEDWLNASGYTGEAGACHQAMSLIRKQEKRIEELTAALKPFADAADELEDKEHGAIWESPAAMCITASDLRNCQRLRDGSRAARAALKKEP